MNFLEAMRHEIKRVNPWKIVGHVNAVQGTMIYVSGIERFLSIGDRTYVERHEYPSLLCEVVGMDKAHTVLMPFGRMEGVGVGNKVVAKFAKPVIYPDKLWLGRVIDAFGNPLDDHGTLPFGDEARLIHAEALPAHKRKRLGSKIDLGVRSIDCFASCCIGQRIGIFSGSGVGKSILLSMIARFSEADIIIVGLIGERGREVREFIEENLGKVGLAKSVIIVATSNEPALTRRQAAYTTLTVAEYFRDLSFNVLCLMDSVTRFAMAIREISLAAGEPPANKGYTPSVFSELPKLLERAGPGAEKPAVGEIKQGDITGLFTVLVEGDDHNEPIADAVRSILDGHIVLDRTIAQRNRLPAVNVLKSVSRTMPGCNSPHENHVINHAKKLLSQYNDMEELIKLGTYQKGSDPDTDQAIQYYPVIEEFLAQKPDEKANSEENYCKLETILDLKQTTNIHPEQQETSIKEQPQSSQSGTMIPYQTVKQMNQIDAIEKNPTETTNNAASEEKHAEEPPQNSVS